MHLITWNNTIFNNVNVFLLSRICCDYIMFTNYISGLSKLLNWGNDLFKSKGGEVISYNDPPLNKQQPTSMAFCTTLYFNLLLEPCTRLLHRQSNEDESRKENVSW